VLYKPAISLNREETRVKKAQRKILKANIIQFSCLKKREKKKKKGNKGNKVVTVGEMELFAECLPKEYKGKRSA
jgi:hypothetical protein